MPSSNPEDRTDNLIRLAIAQQEQRPRPDLERIQQAAGNSLRREDTAGAWRELGIAQGKLGYSPEGEQSLRKAVEINPGGFDALASLGGIRKQKGDLAAAIWQSRASSQVSIGHSYPLLNPLTLEAHQKAALDISQHRIALFRAERSLQAQVKDEPPYNAPWSFFDLAEDGCARLTRPVANARFIENIRIQARDASQHKAGILQIAEHLHRDIA